MQHWCTRVAGALRRKRFPRAFRIEERQHPSIPATIATVQNALDGAVPNQRIQPAPVTDEAAPLFAKLATNVWRLRARMVDPASDRPREEFRLAYRHLESLWDALAGADVRIVDHTGTPFDSGLSLRVLSFEPKEGLTRETVIETLRPTIFHKDKRIQIGEVIVGSPPETQTTP